MLPEDSVLPVLGEFADYETGELLFSKEELLNVTEELLALDEEINAEGFMEFPEYLQGRFDGQNLATINAGSGEASSITKETPVTIIPIYSGRGVLCGGLPDERAGAAGVENFLHVGGVSCQ